MVALSTGFASRFDKTQLPWAGNIDANAEPGPGSDPGTAPRRDVA